MTILLDKLNLYSTFNVTTFNDLESSLDNIPPSMVEYYLDNLTKIDNDSLHLNKSNIEKTLCIDNYSLYKDYGDNIYLEVVKNSCEYESNSLW